MGQLQRFADLVWKREAPKVWRKHPPEVVAVHGELYGGQRTSGCLGRSRIELARHHRDPKVLLHELAHALLNGLAAGHGPKFEAKLIYLLKKYHIVVQAK